METVQRPAVARPRSRWRLDWAATDTFFAVVAGGATALLLARGSGLVGFGAIDLVAGALVWVTLVVLWLMALIQGLRLGTIGHGLLLVPLLTGLLVLLLALDVPSGVRFRVARPALTTWADSQPAGPQRPADWAADDESFDTSVGELQDCPRTLAGYRFEGCEQVFGGVLLWAGTSFLYEVGLVRATTPPEPHDPTSRGSVWDVHPLSDGWYLVTVSS